MQKIRVTVEYQSPFYYVGLHFKMQWGFKEFFVEHELARKK